MPVCEACQGRFHGRPKVFVRDLEDSFETLVLCPGCRAQYPRDHQYTPAATPRGERR